MSTTTRRSPKPRSIQRQWYDYPQYYDLAFRDVTKDEARFLEAAFDKYALHPVHRILEPACGSGRLVAEMASRGYDVEAFDLSEPALRYLRQRLRRRGLTAHVFRADMTDFSLEQPVDAAFCTMNTFRHLLTEEAARSHLQAVARAVVPGGLYILGLHVFPPDADNECVERWSAKHGTTRVTVTLRATPLNLRKRLERIRISMRVHKRNESFRLQDEFALRTYTARQLRRLLASAPQWEPLDVFDFWYDIDDPLELDDEISDTVCVLRRRSGTQTNGKH